MSTRGLELRLSASAENVAIVRHAVAGLAEAVAMEAAAVADLKTVVTEACMNVVVHAYDEDSPGLLEVDAYPETDVLVIVVRDRGAGIRPRADATHQSLRLGLPLIAALASSFEISGGPGRGTEVTMRMALSPDGDGSGAEAAGAQAAGVGRATEMTMPAGELLGPVLSRVISILAARANLSVDRLSDAVLLGDAISARAPGEFADGVARIEAEEASGEVRVRVGPLVDGAGERLLGAMRIPEIGGTLERLANEIRVDRDGEVESVVLRIGQAP
jgi:anti-sigma regulatory factor (Ser/Thr protein kinase)